MARSVRALTAAVAAASLLALTVPAANAAIVTEFGGFTAGGNLNGIVLGPDGALWVAEQTRIARVSPATGQQLEPVTVPAAPGSLLVSLALGPGGTVWATDAGADRVLRIDGTTRIAESFSTAGFSACGPVGLVAGPGDRMFFSLPNADACGIPVIMSLDANGANPSATAAGGGVFDLEVVGDKLLAPDLFANLVRRYTIGASGGLAADGTVLAPDGGGPDGIAIGTDGQVYVTLFNGGGVARMAPTGTSMDALPVPAPFGRPFGITAGPGNAVYATSTDAGRIARIRSDGTVTMFPLPNEPKPWQIVAGPANDDLWYTHAELQNRIGRFINGPPQPVTGDATTPAPTAAIVNGTVDPRGNASEARVEYGTTFSFGATTAAKPIDSGLGPVGVSFELTGLMPSTKYFYRVIASNPEAPTVGSERTFTTPAAPAPGVTDADGDGAAPPLDCNDGNAAIRPGIVDVPGDGIDQDCSTLDAPFPTLGASVVFTSSVSGGVTRVLRLRAIDLTGGEKIVITCKGRGCPRKSKDRKRTISVRRAGVLNILSPALKRARLRAKATVTVQITKAGNVGKVSVATFQAGRRAPKVTRRCLPPGATRAVACV